MRGPMMYPTPSSSGDTSADTVPPLKKTKLLVATSFQSLSPAMRNL